MDELTGPQWQLQQMTATDTQPHFLSFHLNSWGGGRGPGLFLHFVTSKTDSHRVLMGQKRASISVSGFAMIESRQCSVQITCERRCTHAKI